jgi:hypothetical protein
MNARILSLKNPLLWAIAGPMLIGAANLPAQSAATAAHHEDAWKSAPLVRKVRHATARYRDINNAIADGWVQGTPCVSGPNSGAMGVHFVKPERLGDGVLDADEPEALIYEPVSNNRFRLVGVEFITLADPWKKKHPKGDAPALEGHLLNFTSEPNRYGLPAFYEMHVWAWEQNTSGSFADWNNAVSCERQALD